MKRLLLLVFITVSIVLKAQKMELKWEVFHPVKKEWMSLSSMMSVQRLLFENGELPDPFVGKNELLYTWIENHDWEYKSTFSIDSKQLEHQFIDLEFLLVDTYASIYLNGSLISKTDNFFRPYIFQVKEHLKEGENTIKVVFTSPINYHKKRYEKEKFHYPTPNDVAEIKVASRVRKPQYQFGWDWSIRMNTIGLLKPVNVYFYNHNRLINKTINTLILSDTSSIVEFVSYFQQPIQSVFKWESDFVTADKKVEICGNKVSVKVAIKNPKLWWPRGQGEANLYTDKWKFHFDKHDIVEENIQFGIRKTELIQEKDEWGTSYVIKVNNRPIFCKGGDYIPQDVFPSRVKDEAVLSMVNTMKESNFNMVRVWGGGYYPDDIFYKACDENGIMVWQDLMFACSMYPGDSLFLSSVKNELEYQLPRISAHPSVVVFNGNNEVDVAWKNWGFQLKYGIYGKDALEVEKAYDDLFKKLAPKAVDRFTNIPYIHTSPLSNWGKDEYYNSGTMHYWGVWHGKDPIEDFGRKSGRFNAEYGFQSFPEMSTIQKFAEPSEWSLDSDVMKHHQKSYVGNGMIKKHSDLLYGEANDFQRFVYLSQLTQSKAVEIAIAGHRTSMPKCMGTLYWQVNDCWPGPTWSSIDYFGNWKALQYKVRQSYQDVVVLEKTEKIGEETYVLVYNLPSKDTVNCNLTIMDHWGDKIKDTTLVFLMDNLDKKEVFSRKEINQYLNENWIMLKFNVQVGEKQYESSYTILGSEREVPSISSFNYSFEIIEDGKEGELTIENKELLKDFWITYLKAPIFIENNFVDLVPGVHKFKVKLDSDHKGDYGDFFQFYWR